MGMKREGNRENPRADLSGVRGAKSSIVQALFVSSRDSIKVIDLSGDVVLINPAGLEAMEVESLDAIRGQPWRLLWPNEAHTQLDQILANAKQGRHSTATVYRPTAKGTPSWWHVTVSPIFDEAETVVQILAQSHKLGGYPSPPDALSRQLSDQKAAIILLAKQLEAESRRLSETQKQAAQSEKVKLLGQFAGGVVHDINNVLAVMASACRLLRRDSSSGQAAGVLDHAEQAIERGARLVRELLDFSRVSSEDPGVVYLERLLAQDADLLRHLVGFGIDIRLDFPEDLWPVLVPAGKLQTVIFNLFANARDAMPNGGDLRVQLFNCHANERPLGLPPKDYVALTIRDTGKGMTPEVLARAGEPFFTTKEKGSGTGLGLASAFDLAQQCGGRVALDSAPGRGTAITMHIPRAAVASEHADEPTALVDLLHHGGATIFWPKATIWSAWHVGNSAQVAELCRDRSDKPAARVRRDAG